MQSILKNETTIFHYVEQIMQYAMSTLNKWISILIIAKEEKERKK